jgi:4'-phosphopantetheinyl transferase
VLLVETIPIYQWPEQPELPPRGQPVLVRVATPRPHEAPRRELRAALRQVLAAWSGLPPEKLPLAETPCGPRWQGELCGETLDINLSYGPGEGWMGLIRDGRIGVDVAAVAPFAEAVLVARNYLGELSVAEIRQAPSPALAFAIAWTQRESRLKCLKQGLTEWSLLQAEREAHCRCRTLIISDELVGAVSWMSKFSLVVGR